MNQAPSPAQAPAQLIALAAVLDVALVIVFAAIGRSHHGHISDSALAGIWQTAWPFLAALAIVWLLFRVWRAPFSLVRAGLPVWLGTAVIGVAIRAIFVVQAMPPIDFVLVGTAMLGLVLFGWRLVWALVARLRAHAN